ncbi:MAG: SDR family oxidoreductase, partial [Caulobacteraceae bacterium]
GAGYDLALLSRDPDRLEAAAQSARQAGVRAIAIPTDVADADAVDRAASQAEAELGPIDVWVNVAMATVFAPVSALTADEIRRATEVTYLGQVHGVMAALRRMRPRDRGVIVCVGSALAYRSVPLQAVYCGAKFAIRGFLDSLRSELLHDRSAVRVTEVDLPAVNTPQFDWARNKTGKKARPVPPVFQPEVAARAILFAARHPRRQFWVGWPSIKAIVANRFAPGLLDRLLAKSGYSGQLASEASDPRAPGNLFVPVKGGFSAHGRFDAVARNVSWQARAARHSVALLATAGAAIAGLAAWRWLSRA